VPDSGFLLLAFLGHFGKPAHLNEYTELQVLGATADFKGAQLVGTCQQIFQRAYQLLRQARDEGVTSVFASSYALPAHSSSLLALLLVNTEAFVSKRARHSKECEALCPLLGDEDKDRMGRSVLLALQKKMQTALEGTVTAQDVKRVNPFLWERLRCFSCVSDAVPKPIGSGMMSMTSGAFGAENKKNKDRKQAAKQRLKLQYEGEDGHDERGRGGANKKRKRNAAARSAARRERGGAPDKSKKGKARDTKPKGSDKKAGGGGQQKRKKNSGAGGGANS
jgi:hypothetical protein